MIIPIYSNSVSLSLNEAAHIDFGVNTNNFNGSVTKIVMLYDTLKMMHEMIGNAIEQHDKKLHELQRTKGNMN